ncbi:hypothetical protein D3C80_1449000 [compost metagenome]
MNISRSLTCRQIVFKRLSFIHNKCGGRGPVKYRNRSTVLCSGQEDRFRAGQIGPDVYIISTEF